MSIENNLDMRPSGRNEGPIAVDVHQYFKLFSCDDSEEREEQGGNH